MADTVTPLAQALRDGARYGLVHGRDSTGLDALFEGASLRVFAPGPGTRLAVAEGVAVGGYRAVVVLDELVPGPAPKPGVLAVTTSAACARDALLAGWRVVQPWSGDDVAPLIAAAEEPVVVLVADVPDIEVQDPPDPRRTRLWMDGDLATLAASGAAMPLALRLAERLRGRGMDIALVEVAILDDPRQAPLIGGQRLFVAGRDSVSAMRGPWPDLAMSAVELGDREVADLIGGVLAVVPTG